MTLVAIVLLAVIGLIVLVASLPAGAERTSLAFVLGAAAATVARDHRR